MNTIIKILENWVEKSPDKLLFVFLNIKGNFKEKYTYAEFLHRVETLASSLYFNFKSSDRIILLYPPGIEMICSFFACTYIGLIPVPAFPPTSSKFKTSFFRLESIAIDCKASGVLTTFDYNKKFKINIINNRIYDNTFLTHIPWINTENITDKLNFEKKNSSSNILFLQYTSGSTGKPKGVMVSKNNLLHNAEITVDHLPVGVSWLPQYHDMGLIGYYLFFALKGGTTYGFSPTDFIRKPVLWFETITKFRCTASSAPNFAFDYCLIPGKIPQNALKSIDLCSLRYLMNAAEPVRPDTYRKFIHYFKDYGLNPISSFAAYGLAENTLAVTNYGRKSVCVVTSLFKKNVLEFCREKRNEETTKIMSCGRILDGQQVKIVDPTSSKELENEELGEIWISGRSKCLGYYNNPTLSEKIFRAKIVRSRDKSKEEYLRTGDLGFKKGGELYVCGRIKDLIIIRGANYYPHDIEYEVEKASKFISRGYVAAFSVNGKREEELVVVAGLANRRKIPDVSKIVADIYEKLNIQISYLTFVGRKAIPITSSGKIMRNKTRHLWLENKLIKISEFSTKAKSKNNKNKDFTRFTAIIDKYGLKNQNNFLLSSILDSIDMISFMNDLKEAVSSIDDNEMVKRIDTEFMQAITVHDIVTIIEKFSENSNLALNMLWETITKFQTSHRDNVQNLMINDLIYCFRANRENHIRNSNCEKNILCTGGTGFLGPFLIKSLIEQTQCNIYVIVRAKSKSHAKNRLIESMIKSGLKNFVSSSQFKDRVIPVRGDLSEKRIGLDARTWSYLSSNINVIYNNAAYVNYLLNYENMRKVNVLGTKEIINFALNRQLKEINHISTTFIFGWAVKEILYEHDSCDSLDLLDFGYSQTKWVSEQLIKESMKYGIANRIFRPALITPSIKGGGNNFDIAIRLLDFMIKHGIGVDTKNQVSFMPVDITANNIVAIANLSETKNMTFHITRRKYSNIMDITDIITKITGIKFKRYSLDDFIPAVIERCTKNDLLYPLLDFLTKSSENIAAMQYKLYNNDNYNKYITKTTYGKKDASLKDTVKGILLFMKEKKLIEIDLL